MEYHCGMLIAALSKYSVESLNDVEKKTEACKPYIHASIIFIYSQKPKFDSFIHINMIISENVGKFELSFEKFNS